MNMRMYEISGRTFERIMENQQTATVYYLRFPDDKKYDGLPAQLVNEKLEEKLADEGGSILCRQCSHVVTNESQRITVEGAHQHTFANPHGFVYQIGCFRSAIGCGYTGSLTAEWSWFKGFRWRVAVCSSCLIQLGWLFVASSGESFNGLILNRLISDQEKIDPKR